MGGVIFWAQALDNTSPDHIEVRGEKLCADDSVRRQEAVSLVSRAVKSGKRVFNERGVQLTADNRHFVVEVLSAQADCAGRAAPIVCYGEYDGEDVEALGESVAAGLEEFAKRIGRTLHPEHPELARESLAVLKKKTWTRRLARATASGAVAFALLLLVYWLASRGS